jgi:hypothetical protein
MLPYLHLARAPNKNILNGNLLFVSDCTMFFMNKRDSCQTLFQNLGILTLLCMYIYECALFVKKNETRFRDHEINHEHNSRHKYVNIAPKYTRLEFYRKGPVHVMSQNF